MSLAERIPGLTPPRTALIGRDRELQAARDILAQPDARLLTITGVGGSGKTRLALQLAADLAADFPGRAWGVELGPVDDPELLPIVVAGVLGLQESSVTTSQAVLGAYLGTRPALLLLDNCEHLIQACATFVDTLLDACPQLQVIATSREPLHIAGERQYRVPPLDIPDLAAPESVEDIAASPAVQLLVDRMQTVDPEFTLNPENAAAIAGICARLDGIPLALELAAARVRVLMPAQILAGLDDTFGLLAGSSRVAPTRHQTLRAALDWGDALLTEDERAVFRRLSVFAGEFQLEAVAALCADAAPAGVLDVLTSLVDKSLVVAVRDEHTAWYRLLEPVRHYAGEQLLAANEAEAAHARHAAHYVELAERARAGLRGPEQLPWLERLERKHSNFRAAIDWARQQGDSTLELRLVVALSRFWEIRGHLREGLQRTRGAIERSAAGPHTPEALRLRMRALAGAGRLAFYFDHTLTSQYREAEELSAASLQIARELDDRHGIATALSDLAMIHRLQNDFARSLAVAEQAIDTFDGLDDEHSAATAQLQLALAIYYHGDPDRTTRLLRASLERFRALEDQRMIALTLTLMGRIAHERGEIEPALESVVEGLTMHLHVGDRWFVSWDLFALSDVLIDAGDPRMAVRFSAAAQALSDRLGSPVGGVSFKRVATLLESLSDAEWFAATWEAGYALAPADAARAARALLDGAGPDEPPTRPVERAPDALTRRELEVARLIAAGQSNREIADTLYIALPTVTTHVHRILQKLDLSSRYQVADWLAAQESADTHAG